MILNAKCPECGWVKPLHPMVEMKFCPCGWKKK